VDYIQFVEQDAALAKTRSLEILRPFLDKVKNKKRKRHKGEEREDGGMTMRSRCIFDLQRSAYLHPQFLFILSPDNEEIGRKREKDLVPTLGLAIARSPLSIYYGSGTSAGNGT